VASAITYGERMLLEAERKARARSAKRRRLTLLAPTALVTFWSLADLVAARSARLSSLDAAFLHRIFDHTEVVAWTFAFVMLPLMMAVKPDPLPSGALLAFFAGPVLTPLLFGPGGWKLWQGTALTVIAALILAAHYERERMRRARSSPSA
jgi:hypothetical protein